MANTKFYFDASSGTLEVSYFSGKKKHFDIYFVYKISEFDINICKIQYNVGKGLPCIQDKQVRDSEIGLYYQISSKDFFNSGGHFIQQSGTV